MFELITIGDTTTDVFLDITEEGHTMCKKNNTDCQICFPYGAKIPVKHIATVHGAGNAANVAIGAARLGLRTAIYTVLGGDDRGREVRSVFKKEHISRTYVVEDRKGSTNYSTILNYTDDRTIFAYHAERVYRLPKLKKSRCVYFSSISGNHLEFQASLLAHVKATKTPLAFNPGSRQMRLGVRALMPVLAATEILFVNRDEAIILAGKGTMPKLFEKLHALGPSIVNITDGAAGAYASDRSGIHHCPVVDVPVVQRTGCGDAYASGFMAAWLEKKSLRDAMCWGSMNAAGVIQAVGSHAGLLRRHELEKALQSLKYDLPTLVRG